VQSYLAKNVDGKRLPSCKDNGKESMVNEGGKVPHSKEKRKGKTMFTPHIASSSTRHPCARADWNQGFVTSAISQGKTTTLALHSPSSAMFPPGYEYRTEP